MEILAYHAIAIAKHVSLLLQIAQIANQECFFKMVSVYNVTQIALNVLEQISFAQNVKKVKF